MLISDVNTNTEVLDTQHCQTRAMLIIELVFCINPVNYLYVHKLKNFNLLYICLYHIVNKVDHYGSVHLLWPPLTNNTGLCRSNDINSVDVTVCLLTCMRHRCHLNRLASAVVDGCWKSSWLAEQPALASVPRTAAQYTTRVQSTKVLCPLFDEIETLILGDSPSSFPSLSKMWNSNSL